jgi:hypothetical protein
MFTRAVTFRRLRSGGHVPAVKVVTVVAGTSLVILAGTLILAGFSTSTMSGCLAGTIVIVLLAGSIASMSFDLKAGLAVNRQYSRLLTPGDTMLRA